MRMSYEYYAFELESLFSLEDARSIQWFGVSMDLRIFQPKTFFES